MRHDEKITVYVSQDELLALEQARLTLRAKHGMAVDRGRIVREAIAAALADLETNGGESDVVRRLSYLVTRVSRRPRTRPATTSLARRAPVSGVRSPWTTSRGRSTCCCS